MKIKTYNNLANESGELDLPEAVFGLKWNADLVFQVVNGQRANQRPKVAHVKTRAEVRGGGKKPWKQKGTGRARHGSIRSPIWVGGGVAHGPNPDENYKKKINKKMARKALFTVLSAKAKDKEIVIMDDFNFAKPQTKMAAQILQKFAEKEEFKKITKRNGVLVALDTRDKNARLSLQNLPYVAIVEARNLTALEALQYKYILFPPQSLKFFAKQ